jgi:hypothetical protein
MKTIISLAGAGPAAIYNLWKELNSTNNAVEVVFMDFSNNDQASPGLKKIGNKLAVERVCNLLKQKERDFTLTIKNVDTFTKEFLWPMEVIYYAIDKFKANQADKLSFHFIKDEENEYDICRKYFQTIEYRSELATTYMPVYDLGEKLLIIPRYSALPHYKDLEIDINNIR